MGDVINLRQARKAKGRLDKARQAAENRVRYGQTAEQRKHVEGEQERLNKIMRGLRRDKDVNEENK